MHGSHARLAETPMPRTVAYHHFLISPWSYLAIGRFNALVEHSGAIVDYLPIDVGGTFSEMGGTPPAKRHPARQRFRLEELARWSHHLGVPMNLEPAHFPADQTQAACMVHAATAGAGLAEGEDPRRAAGRLSDAVLTAVWRDERNVADPDTLVALAGDAGLDGQALAAAAAKPAARERYAEATRAAHERGVFGSPTWVIGDDLFWGQDRLDFVALALGITPADG